MIKVEKINNEIIEPAVKILDFGGVLVAPTETCYGLVADATNKQAVEKIYKIKGRSFNKFLPLIASNLEQIKQYFKVSQKELELLRDYNGTSVVLAAKEGGIYLVKDQRTCAVRMSSNVTVNILAYKLGRPITATSANISGEMNCYTMKDLLTQFAGGKFKPDLILDGGRLENKKPSTIVKVEDDKVIVLRQGEVEV